MAKLHVQCSLDVSAQRRHSTCTDKHPRTKKRWFYTPNDKAKLEVPENYKSIFNEKELTCGKPESSINTHIYIHPNQ
jgi:hypothetical protein